MAKLHILVTLEHSSNYTKGIIDPFVRVIEEAVERKTVSEETFVVTTKTEDNKK